MKKNILFLLYCTSFFLFSIPREVQAQVIFEDQFNRQDLTGWKTIRNFQWGNPVAPCLDGGLPALWHIFLERLGISINGPGCYTELIPENFLIPLDTAFRYEFDMTMPESAMMDRNYLVQYVDSNNWYVVKILGNSITSGKLAQGQPWPMAGTSGTYPFEANRTYHIVNETLPDHRKRILVDGQVVVDFMDNAPYLSGGTVGVAASVGAISHSITWFDNVKVSIIPDPNTLNVPYMSQRDPLWAQDEYDHAAQWKPDNFTIDRWGCALTVATMVLRFHGITELPNQMPITPSTLNQWLLDQKDGYVGNGLLNWISISRLSYIFHTKHPEIPTLEYSKMSISLPKLFDLFSRQTPPIYQLPGHFVVGTAPEKNGSWPIHDPFFQSRTTTPLSNIQSLRVFTPSFTNLSYLLLVAPHDVTVRVQHNGVLYDSQLENSVYDQDSQEPLAPPTQIVEIEKPEKGLYTVEVSKSSPGSFSFSLYSYSTQGEVLVEKQEGEIFHGEIKKYRFTFDQENLQNNLHQYITIDDLEHTVLSLREKDDIQSAYSLYKLTDVLQYLRLHHSSELIFERYINLFKYYVIKEGSGITDGGKAKLLEQLSFVAPAGLGPATFRM